MRWSSADGLKGMENPTKRKDTTGKFSHFNWLNVFRTTQLLCDRTLRTQDGGHFPVHGAVMASCSPYFIALFTSTVSGKSRNDFVIPGINKLSLAYIIQFAYTRQVSISWRNVKNIVLSADYLNVSALLRRSSSFLIKNMTIDNVVGILNFARHYCFKDVEEKAFRFIVKNFTTVSENSDEWIHLDEDALYDILGEDRLNTQNEESVWEAALRWINFDPDTRRDKVLNLIQKVRLGLLEAEYLMERIKEHEYVTSSPVCRPYLLRAVQLIYSLDQSGEHEVTIPKMSTPRIHDSILFAMGGWSGGNPTTIVETYDIRANKWSRIEQTDPMGPRAYHGCVVVENDVYVIGGFDGLEYFSSCRCFNVDTQEWRSIAPMNCRRCYVSVAFLNGFIYAMGGYNGQHRQNTAERYDPSTNQWSLITPMQVQRSDASATSHQNLIYIVGGFTGQECINTAEVYDPNTNQWTILSPMRSRRSGVSCIAHGDYVYALGGFNGVSRLSSVERFSPATNTWFQVRDMLSPRSNFAVAVLDDWIFVMGGFNGVTTTQQAECYEQTNDSWFEISSMHLTRSALSACVVCDPANLNHYIYLPRQMGNREQMLKRKFHKRPEMSVGDDGGR